MTAKEEFLAFKTFYDNTVLEMQNEEKRFEAKITSAIKNSKIAFINYLKELGLTDKLIEVQHKDKWVKATITGVQTCYNFAPEFYSHLNDDLIVTVVLENQIERNTETIKTFVKWFNKKQLTKYLYYSSKSTNFETEFRTLNTI